MKASAVLLILTGAIAMALPRPALALVGGQAVLPSDRDARHVAQIVSWSEEIVDGQVVRSPLAPCTAVFVAEDLLLTAAHCVLIQSEAQPGKMQLRSHGVGRALGERAEFEFKEVRAHPQFSEKAASTLFTTTDELFADLALIKINKRFSGRGAPIFIGKLAPVSPAQANTAHSKYFSYGQGITNPKAKDPLVNSPFAGSSALAVQVKDHFARRPFARDLRKAEFDIERTPAEFRFVLSNGQKALGHSKVDQVFVRKVGKARGGHCFGDSGGPTFKLEAGKTPAALATTIAGLTSLMVAERRSAMCRQSTAMISFAPHEKWLSTTAQELGSPIRFSSGQ